MNDTRPVPTFRDPITTIVCTERGSDTDKSTFGGDPQVAGGLRGASWPHLSDGVTSWLVLRLLN